MDFIQGDKFIGLADYTYSPLKKRGDDYDQLPNTLNVSKVKDGDIIYTHTFYAQQLFEVIRGMDKCVKVISHNSDANVDFPPPDNVTMWFTQNVNIIHPRIQSIPIGLENDRWFSGICKKEKMFAKLREPKKYKNLVYMNHNIATNPTKRKFLYDMFENKPWVTAVRGTNGSHFDEYLDNIYTHKFVICPEGNGIDTHRIWECLYMGTIPIVDDNINNTFYFDLPIIRADTWDVLSEGLLKEVFGDMPHHKYNTELLKFGYWINKIRQI